ncbi:MAG: molybdopterin molybdotransferase MoeA, partial [Candidatus Zipacnadales bacterium]
MAAHPKGFFRLKTLDEVRRIEAEHFASLRVGTERLPSVEALGRVLAEEIRSPGPVPHFSRSIVDGYAVRAADTAGASAGLPAYLEIIGRVVMGRPVDVILRPGQCVEIPTGGMLPQGADAAVMIEHTELLGESTVEVSQPVSVGQNVISVGEDVAPGQLCLKPGVRLRAGELALLATLGVSELTVYRRPLVALLSTGDEVVPPDTQPGPAEIRDANAWGLSAMVVEAGGIPRFEGIIHDVQSSLAQAAGAAFESVDVVIISGGSSIGERDLAKEILDDLGKPGVLVHGVALKPGKPTIIGLAEGKPVFGLPGHPVSAMISFHRIVRPILRRLGGETDLTEPTVMARLSRKVPSESGRTECVRVKLVETDDGLLAEPLFGKSAALSSIIAARGFFEIPLGVEGYDEGTIVKVI